MAQYSYRFPIPAGLVGDDEFLDRLAEADAYGEAISRGGELRRGSVRWRIEVDQYTMLVIDFDVDPRPS